MLQLTKIIATIGPASDSEEKIAALIKRGVNIFRFNFKHNTTDWHSDRIDRVNRVAKELNVHIGTLIDLQGPEVRIKMLNDKMKIEKGESILLDERLFVREQSSSHAFSISHPSIIPYLKTGQRIIADDGAFEFEVQKLNGKTYLLSQSSGVLLANKSMNIPGADFPLPTLIDKDLEGMALAQKKQVDFIALSFVRSKNDVIALRREMKKNNMDSCIVAKIETKQAIENLDEIIDAADGVMVARGDLAIELALEKVPFYQKIIIKKCVEKGKFVITATQMLESMISSPFPTRAEVSDVANAVFDNTSAVMLSGETATGAYPEKTVHIMKQTICFSDTAIDYDLRLNQQYVIADQEALMCEAAYDLYRHAHTVRQKIKGFIVLTHTGRTARLISRYRPRVPIYTFCPTTAVAEALTIEFGVYPLLQDATYVKQMEVTGGHVRAAIAFLKKMRLVVDKDSLIVLHGDRWAEEGGTSTAKLVTV